ncbi:hypothetical protein L249_7434 [Ophiocordyceps polyrhachis-furcata BCC 54312]|uniref:Uncharacterized protein n=1 Tax=Ophiocordyceps polyrhachis-furcata BCC 54312 TaxID=1330021 RepID=A0A367LBC7_9HYPO|nr:hypothetical protein L249_7434 [Ophiocordyceps polyrhachis-furcata BCC 54312]
MPAAKRRSICLRYSVPGHFLKSCNLRLARRPSISRPDYIAPLNSCFLDSSAIGEYPLSIGTYSSLARV